MVVAPRYADYDVTPVEKVDPFPPIFLAWDGQLAQANQASSNKSINTEKERTLCLQGPTKRIACHGTEIGYYLHQSKGVDWVFVDHPSYPRPGGIYADQYGVYGDNQVCADRIWLHSGNDENTCWSQTKLPRKADSCVMTTTLLSVTPVLGCSELVLDWLCPEMTILAVAAVPVHAAMSGSLGSASSAGDQWEDIWR